MIVEIMDAQRFFEGALSVVKDRPPLFTK